MSESIVGFSEVRKDGKLIDASTSTAELLAIGISPVVELRWKHRGETVRYVNPDGVLGQVVAGRRYVACITSSSAPDRAGALDLLNAEGQRERSVSQQQLVANALRTGRFVWFERAPSEVYDVVTAVFAADDGGPMVQLDIDASTGKVIGSRPVR